MKTTESLIRIVTAGGGLILDCKGKSTESLTRIAEATKSKNSKITLINIGSKSTESLIKIVAAGNGNVVLDLTM